MNRNTGETVRSRREFAIGFISSSLACPPVQFANAQTSSNPASDKRAPAKPSFSGPLDVRLLDDGQKIQLLTDYAFSDSSGDRWGVPAGFVSDGASIPRPLWSFIGSPLTGRYRNAAVIHDFYCASQDRDWEKTHLVFYEAMLAHRVSPKLAWLMYVGVYRFGPKWKLDLQNFICPCYEPPPVLENFSPKFIEADLRAIVDMSQSGRHAKAGIDLARKQLSQELRNKK